MLSLLSRLRGKFLLLRRVWSVNIAPHFFENHELSRAALIRGQRLNRVNTANTHTTHNFSSRSDEGLTLEASALKLLMVVNLRYQLR